ncbi:hypothetical protein Hanom_Chr10g00934061 [Helianthus anomalus]
MEILVKRKGVKLNPISMLFYVSPCRQVCIFLEMPKMESWSFQPFVLTLNSLCTFALNLSVFLVIQHTSALTIRVAGAVKDWVVVLLSAILFADTRLSLVNLIGYAIVDQKELVKNVNTNIYSIIDTAIAGVVAYNNYKLKKEACEESPENFKFSTTGTPSFSKSYSV